MSKAVLITGAAGGIGAALCKKFADSGLSVIATDLADKPVGDHPYFPFDLSELGRSQGARTEFLNNVTGKLGSAQLHAVINNAAVQILGSTRELSQESWDQVLGVNLLAPFWITNLLLKNLESSKGSVVNISSIHAKLTKPGFVAYATSKAALVGLTKSLAVDLGGRVRINAICPAAVDTKMLRNGFSELSEIKLDSLSKAHPTGRIGNPDEVATLAHYLTSPEAQFITGAAFEIDGGISSRLHDPE